MRNLVVSLCCVSLLGACVEQGANSDVPPPPNYLEAQTQQECTAAARKEVSDARRVQHLPPTSTGEALGQIIGKGIAMGIIKSRAKRHLETCLMRLQSQGVTLYLPDGTPVPPSGASSSNVEDAAAALSAAPSSRHTPTADRPYGCTENAPVMYRGDLICVRD